MSKLTGQDWTDQLETEKMMLYNMLRRTVSVLETMMVDECVHPAYLILVAETLQGAWSAVAWIEAWDKEQAA